MIRHNCQQGSDVWLELRRGKPTASVLDQIITLGGKLSKSADKLMYKLAAERILGYSLENFTSGAMEAGREREPEAADYYAFEHEVELEEVGICFSDDGRVGASPDRLIPGGGLLEIKCPMPHTHVGYLLNGSGISTDYKVQIQAQIWICEADWLDSLSYCPPLPRSLVRVDRDDVFISIMEGAVRDFCDALDEAEHKLRRMSDPAWREPVPEPKPKVEEVNWRGVFGMSSDAGMAEPERPKKRNLLA